ncbi:hypothetical protein VI03_24890 [Burkholderia vietnamiensis]|uniref:hypothetical protein n=1 Tax=Burkholderia vietnamiensis TaxID=60552 RepID=UPI000621957A|nr:hypothetical protein [Burkholderia vietnamiensis]KKI36021.1 hypothetical protein VI03_24890 [Burkholderia vietnamiensis]MBR8189228.1 hypothetical protein [Burkholderia vietnamiensis]HDR9174433.1 hypothetical protein [Burkholderia vietnamiensis]
MVNEQRPSVGGLDTRLEDQELPHGLGLRAEALGALDVALLRMEEIDALLVEWDRLLVKWQPWVEGRIRLRYRKRHGRARDREPVLVVQQTCRRPSGAMFSRDKEIPLDSGARRLRRSGDAAASYQGNRYALKKMIGLIKARRELANAVSTSTRGLKLRAKYLEAELKDQVMYVKRAPITMGK